MSGADGTYDNLISFGVDTVLAREASKRYAGNVEAAADWCFGAGSNWKPDPVSEPPKYGVQSGRQFEHHEVAEDMNFANIGPKLSNTAPPLPPRHQPATSGRPIIGSNNPFHSATNPSTQSRDHSPVMKDEDFDEDLQRALRLSEGVTSGDVDTGVERDERERSVRATAPPPSPNSKPEGARLKELDELAEEGEVMSTLFGPSTREEEGASAMMSLRGTEVKPSKEDEDLNRAIQDSLMTASFHSASAVNHVERPRAAPKQDGAPVIFLSESGEATCGSHLLQAMYAIPQVREVILHFAEAEGGDQGTHDAPLGAHSLAHLFRTAQTSEESFLEVDNIVDSICASRGSQLPPSPVYISVLESFGTVIEGAMYSAIQKDPALKDRGELWADPRLIIHSKTNPLGQDPSPRYVRMGRRRDVAYRVCPNLATILWPYDTPSTTIEEISEVMTVFLEWGFDSERKLWDLEERVVLDRFMKENEAWSTQIRAQQNVAKGAHRRLKEKVDQLTTFQGNNVHDSLSTIIKHYESAPPDSDNINVQLQAELKAKLSATLEKLRAKTDTLSAELKREEEVVNGSLFDTDAPEHNQHAYSLRAVLMHDGAVIPGKHLYAYIRSDDGKWWKIVDHECSEVTWEAIRTDQTGLYMGGGPYALIYARETPRPPKTYLEGEATVNQGDTDITMGDDSKRFLEEILKGFDVTKAAATAANTTDLGAGANPMPSTETDNPSTLLPDSDMSESLLLANPSTGDIDPNSIAPSPTPSSVLEPPTASSSGAPSQPVESELQPAESPKPT